MTISQEYAFMLNAPGSDWFFLHGMSNSSRVACAIKRCTGVKVCKVGKIAGHLLAVDLTDGDFRDFRLLNIYVPAYPQLQKKFYDNCTLFAVDNMMVVGDFNSVIDRVDRLSGNLDSTSALLKKWLGDFNLVEIDGSHRRIFTYHHPLAPEWKSRIDRIYSNFACTKGYALPVSFSDHYLVGFFYLAIKGSRPKTLVIPC